MQDILVYERFNEMRMCISFEWYYVFFSIWSEVYWALVVRFRPTIPVVLQLYKERTME